VNMVMKFCIYKRQEREEISLSEDLGVDGRLVLS
jgi:hypothetical protein